VFNSFVSGISLLSLRPLSAATGRVREQIIFMSR
jgi:hypothetical protein